MIKQYYDENIEKTQMASKALTSEQKKEADLYYKSIQNFIVNENERNSKFSKMGWKLTIVLSICCVLQSIALTVLTPLKTAVPYVMRVDSTSGYIDIAKPLADDKVTYDEVLSKYFLKEFVINRESYDWDTIQNMFDITKLLSNNNVFSEYEFNIQSALSPLNVLRKDKKVVVTVRGITFINNLAQVRFVKLVKNKDGTPATGYKPTTWIATIDFDYKKEIKTEAERLENPLGFEVISYRVDVENVEVK
ncbi:type IV secretion system protein [Gilliamella sp. B2824]|uniref:virB8 family protein n=1 Tax=Gilliamella sp. B2824 TaxID=2818019 RepID=UPI00226996DB|nr:type IV secretion system protein [Gilliamella sp. B2824]MCX8738126.1 type IV secretion system protein [Gilliamella sp. B2824]